MKYSKNVPKSFSCRSQSIKIFKLQSWRERRYPWTLGTEKAQHFQETQHKEQLLAAKQQFHSEKCFLSKCHELARAREKGALWGMLSGEGVEFRGLSRLESSQVRPGTRLWLQRPFSVWKLLELAARDCDKLQALQVNSVTVLAAL